MTPVLSTLALVLALGSAPSAEVHLLTMGPGDHLYTRGGHAALMVVRDDGSWSSGCGPPRASRPPRTIGP